MESSITERAREFMESSRKRKKKESREWESWRNKEEGRLWNQVECKGKKRDDGILWVYVCDGQNTRGKKKMRKHMDERKAKN